MTKQLTQGGYTPMDCRLIITLECSRNCFYCCNKNPDSLSNMTPVTAIENLAVYNSIVLTGGEPLEKPDLTKKLILGINRLFPTKQLYLYTSKFHTSMYELIPLLDGITFTLHQEHSDYDLIALEQWKHLQSYYRCKSFRYLIPEPIMIYPRDKSTSRIRFNPSGYCPCKEQLLLWQGE